MYFLFFGTTGFIRKLSSHTLPTLPPPSVPWNQNKSFLRGVASVLRNNIPGGLQNIFSIPYVFLVVYTRFSVQGAGDCKELIAWGGSLPDDRIDVSDDTGDVTSIDATPWAVDDDLQSMILEGYLRGWGIGGKNVDLEHGTALAPLQKDVRRWNAACVIQIEQRHGKHCDAVDVLGYDWRFPGSTPTRQKRIGSSRVYGVQAPEVLQLRTCAEHRMRVMLIHNLDPSHGWANGTAARLLPTGSWGCKKPQLLRRDLLGRTHAEQVHLADVNTNGDFHVRVVKDQQHTLAKSVRFSQWDLQSVGAHNESGKGRSGGWRQIQLILAYALTLHKVGPHRNKGYRKNIFPFNIAFMSCLFLLFFQVKEITGAQSHPYWFPFVTLKGRKRWYVFLRRRD